MTTDANDKSQDAIPVEGQGSGEKSQKDSTQPKMYTEDEVEAKFSQQRSVLDKKITGLEKTAKSYEGKDTEIAGLKSRLAQIVKEAEDKEWEDARDDLPRQTLIRRERALHEKEVGLTHREQVATQKESEFEERFKATEQTEREIAIWGIAKEDGTDPTALKDLNLDIEQTKVVSKAMKATKPTVPIIPDSGRSIGGSEKTEEQKLDERYPTMK